MNKSKKRGPPEKASLKKILKAIPGTGGLKSAIAVKLGVHYRTILNYEAKYKTVRQAIDEEKEKILDKAESVLFVRIQNGDEDTCKWFLARKGKQRGYTERTEVTGKEGEGIQLIYKPASYDKDEKEGS